MSSDIERNVLSIVKNRKFFALQVGECTEISCKLHILAFVCFIVNETIVEDFLCCKELPETTKRQDVYDALNSHLQSCELTWQNCVRISTDGTHAMTGNVKGLVSLAQQWNFKIMTTHCFLHREALISGTAGPN